MLHTCIAVVENGYTRMYFHRTVQDMADNKQVVWHSGSAMVSVNVVILHCLQKNPGLFQYPQNVVPGLYLKVARL